MGRQLKFMMRWFTKVGPKFPSMKFCNSQKKRSFRVLITDTIPQRRHAGDQFNFTILHFWHFLFDSLASAPCSVSHAALARLVRLLLHVFRSFRATAEAAGVSAQLLNETAITMFNHFFHTSNIYTSRSSTENQSHACPKLLDFFRNSPN